MKKTIVCALLIIISISSFGQQMNPSTQLTKQDYMKKSKNQKAFGWALLSGGLLLTTMGSIQFNFAGSDPDKSNNQKAYLAIGLISSGISIPFFIAASKNRKKAMSFSFGYKQLPQLYAQSPAFKNVPSLSLNVQF